MAPGNRTVVSEFLIIGFYNLYGFKIPLFILLLILFFITCLQSLLIILLVSTSIRLQTPMYFILRSMSICEFLYAANFIPKMLQDILSERASISIIGCLIQIHVLSVVGNVLSFIYALMSYDRYIAIGFPLRYSYFINNRLCNILLFVFCLISFTCGLSMSILQGQLVFCAPNIIDHFYCDYVPIVELACSNATLVKMVAIILSAVIILLPLTFGMFSYIFIIYTIIQIQSSSGRKKAFSTCASHLLVSTISYCSLIFIYVLPNGPNSLYSKKLSLVNIIVIPLVYPAIYTLRNRGFHKAMEDKIVEVKRFFYT